MLSLLEAQKRDGLQGYRLALTIAEANGLCRPFGRAIPAKVEAVEYFGLLSDGHNFMLGVGSDLWVVHVSQTGPQGQEA